MIKNKIFVIFFAICLFTKTSFGMDGKFDYIISVALSRDCEDVIKDILETIDKLNDPKQRELFTNLYNIVYQHIEENKKYKKDVLQIQELLQNKPERYKFPNFDLNFSPYDIKEENPESAIRSCVRYIKGEKSVKNPDENVLKNIESAYELLKITCNDLGRDYYVVLQENGL